MIYIQKILALRIFTIKFKDADLFAKHAVYGKYLQCTLVLRGALRKKKMLKQTKSRNLHIDEGQNQKQEPFT